MRFTVLGMMIAVAVVALLLWFAQMPSRERLRRLAAQQDQEERKCKLIDEIYQKKAKRAEKGGDPATADSYRQKGAWHAARGDWHARKKQNYERAWPWQALQPDPPYPN
jgi:hypothetical protein